MENWLIYFLDVCVFIIDSVNHMAAVNSGNLRNYAICMFYVIRSRRQIDPIATNHPDASFERNLKY